MPASPLTLDALRIAVSTTAPIDTVVLAITDMQGRLQGKRLDAHATSSTTSLDARHRGLQLPARRRRRDEHRRRLRDLVLGARLRRLRDDARPGHPAPRALAAGHRAAAGRRRSWLDGTPVAESPRQILQAPARPAGRARLDRLRRHRTRVHRVRRHLRAGVATSATATSTPANQYNVDYSILGTSRVEPLLRRDPHGMRGRRACRSSRPRASATSASTRSRSSYDDALTHLRQPRHLQDRRQGDRGAAGHVADLHGQVQRARGQLLPHPPVAARRATASRCSPATGPAECRRCSSSSSPASSPALRELSCFFAPNINSYKRYQPGSFAPTAVPWGWDNRTCALRVVGHGPSLRFENRVPGGDVNPYLAVAAMIAAGLHGIDNELDARSRRSRATPTAATPPRVPTTLREAAELWAASAIARGGVRRRRRRPLRQHSPRRARRVRRGGDRLGTRPRLRADVRPMTFTTLRRHQPGDRAGRRDRPTCSTARRRPTRDRAARGRRSASWRAVAPGRPGPAAAPLRRRGRRATASTWPGSR